MALIVYNVSGLRQLYASIILYMACLYVTFIRTMYASKDYISFWFQRPQFFNPMVTANHYFLDQLQNNESPRVPDCSFSLDPNIIFFEEFGV
ncbi:hypothetical protein LIER_13387 [Lithospermum erythrorhizon]|uniref:Uncharacterized protein n=1 Tax=Lithospermum erythrorhizon TaxID=34254 RepID=A0AAV3PV85_LITER